MQSEENTPTRAGFVEAIERCAEAWHRVRAELPPGAFRLADQANQQKAALAYLAQLPILSDPAAFQVYIACIAQGVALGAVDIVDAGRLCHLAQTAMSAWKLANLTVPAATEKREQQAQKSTHPLPPKGNQPAAAGNSIEDREQREAALSLPDRSTQDKLYK